MISKDADFHALRGMTKPVTVRIVPQMARFLRLVGRDALSTPDDVVWLVKAWLQEDIDTAQWRRILASPFVHLTRSQIRFCPRSAGALSDCPCFAIRRAGPMWRDSVLQ
jgi:hypothetical protein